MLSVACTGFWLLIVISGLKLKAYPEWRYMIMKNKDLEYFRKMLTRWQEDLYKQADVTVSDLQEPTVKAIGVAKPKAQGQAIINTAMAFTKA